MSLFYYILLFAVAGFCSCSEDEFFFKISPDTEAAQSVIKIESSFPVHFYRKRHQSVYAHNNGFVTFDDKKIWSPVDFVQSRVVAPCMVEIQDFNDLGKISIQSSVKSSHLIRASADVYSHFVYHSDFVAKELVIITWKGLLSKESTIQAVFIIGERRTFVEFLFKIGNGYNLKNEVSNLNAQAGLSSGDRMRFTELLDFRAGRNISMLFSNSNTMKNGKWMFLIGSSDENFFQVQSPDAYSSYDSFVRKQIRKDINECNQIISPCHLYADCFNLDPGYNCTCHSGYFGNGKVCLRKDGRVKLIGKFSGIVNNAVISDSDFDAFFTRQRGGLYVSVGPIGPKTGYYLQMVPPIVGILGWLFGPSSSKTGFDVVGNRFSATSIVIFQAGEALKVTQQMKGFDSFNFLIFDTKIEGNMPLPIVKESSIHKFEPHTETYEVASNGNIYSDGRMTYVLDGRSINYTVNRVVDFEQIHKNIKYKSTVQVSDPAGFYNEGNSLLRFTQKFSAVSSSETKDDVDKALPTPRAPEIITEEVRFKTESIPVNPTSEEVRTTRQAPTTAKAPYTEDEKSLSQTTQAAIVKEIISTQMPTTSQQVATRETTTAKATCNGRSCSQFAVCQINNAAEKCVCKEGYTGNGIICNVDTRIRCGSYMCHENGECIREQSQYFCKCKRGFVGDGLDCQTDIPCTCHMNAECYSNGKGSKYCLCKLGFKGDGKKCRDIDECTETKISCQSHSKCVNSIGSYECVCDDGFRKNDSKCVDIPECSEEENACGDGAVCTEIPGSYKCSCPKGFHFGYGKRDCFPDCPRCLNGGTCVGKFGCKCAPGFSGFICQWVGDEFLLYSQGGNIKRFSYPYGSMSYGYIYRNPQHLMVGVDYDCQNKKVYWTDITSKTIQRANYDGSDMETIVNGLQDPQGLTIDWLGRNMYWTDNGNKQISVAGLDGKNRKALFTDDLRHPRPIVCNPYTGQLFWADWDRRRPRIEVSSMDGSDRKVLVSRGVGLPNGLTINYKSRDICWTDAAVEGLSCVGFDGRNQRNVAKKIGYPFGITMHQSKIFWTNWATDNIGRFDVVENKVEPEVKSGFGQDGRILDIKSVSACPARQNICSDSNGGCTHFCLVRNNGGRSCACPDNLEQGDNCLETRN